MATAAQLWNESRPPFLNFFESRPPPKGSTDRYSRKVAARESRGCYGLLVGTNMHSISMRLVVTIVSYSCGSCEYKSCVQFLASQNETYGYRQLWLHSGHVAKQLPQRALGTAMRVARHRRLIEWSHIDRMVSIVKIRYHTHRHNTPTPWCFVHVVLFPRNCEHFQHTEARAKQEQNTDY